MTSPEPVPSARRAQLLELAYQYTLAHGLADLSLRPLATAIGSSPRVLLYLFGSKDELVRAILARARADELAMLDNLGRAEPSGLLDVAQRVWTWLAADEHRAILALWVEGYARSLVDPGGAWAGFAQSAVDDWLDVLAAAQPAAERRSVPGRSRRTIVLALLRGAMLDLVATGDTHRITTALRAHLRTL